MLWRAVSSALLGAVGREQSELPAVPCPHCCPRCASVLVFLNMSATLRVPVDADAGCAEFMVMHAHVVIVVGLGDYLIRPLLRDPVPLREKKALNLYSAGASFVQRPRQVGHRGLEVLQFIWDGGLFDSLDRLWGQHGPEYERIIPPAIRAVEAAFKAGHSLIAPATTAAIRPAYFAVKSSKIDEWYELLCHVSCKLSGAVITVTLSFDHGS